MSLVERALKKLQETKAASAAPAAPAPIVTPQSPAIASGSSQPTTEPIGQPPGLEMLGDVSVQVVAPPAVVEAAPPPSPSIEPKVENPTITIEAEILRVQLARPKWNIDRDVLRETGVLPPEPQERLIAEQYRRIKRPLIANLNQKGEKSIEHARSIMMTSALPGDGKTYTSINLAFSLAREKDTDCLLIDADVAKPHISDIFGLQNERGLLEALSDENLDVESLVIPTDIPGLYLLPAGKPIEGATELLASVRMQHILERLERADSRRISLFDSPPLLLSSESRVLVNLMGQIVLVVRAGVTPKQAVFDAIGNIEENKYVGVILNQSETAPSGDYYGYGYGYGVYGNSPPAAK